MSESKSKKKKDFNLTRRTVLKAGAVSGAAAVLTRRKGFKTHFNVYAADGPIPQDPPVCTPQPAQSPPTTPFMQKLPIPFPAIPKWSLNPTPTKAANIAAGEAPRADHQRWEEFLPVVKYEVHAKPALHQFHPEIPPSYVWGFDGKIPGPTFIAAYDYPMLVRFYNDLPVDHTGFGVNETTIHLHNHHVGSESDGFAGDYYGPQLWKDFHYPNILAGYDAFPPKGDIKEAMHTFWYHDHRHSFTAPNNYRGLNGMFFLYDHIDTGFENDNRETALRLPAPYGIHDIPLIFTDKRFCPDGTLFHNNPGGSPAGDKFVVNGAIQPYFQVRRRKYRFRMLNTGPARIWTFSLSNNQAMTVVCTDGNLLEHPIDVQSLEIHVSSRFDVVIDFSNAQIGESIYLLNNQAQFVSNAPEPVPLPPGVGIGNVVLRFDVIGNPHYQDNSRILDTLTQYPVLDLNEVVGTRIWNFDLISGQFVVNGLIFDENRSDADVQQGTAEKWILRNKLPLAGWTHPIHIHFEEGRVLSRNGGPPPPLETGRRDVYPLRGGDELEVFLRFRDFKGKYMIHCHNLNHEDNFMLVRWDIVDNPPPQPIATFIPNKKGGRG